MAGVGQGKAKENYDKAERGKPYRDDRMADSIGGYKEAKQSSGWSWWVTSNVALFRSKAGAGRSAPNSRPGLQNFWMVLCLQIQANSASWG